MRSNSGFFGALYSNLEAFLYLIFIICKSFCPWASDLWQRCSTFELYRQYTTYTWRFWWSLLWWFMIYHHIYWHAFEFFAFFILKMVYIEMNPFCSYNKIFYHLHYNMFAMLLTWNHVVPHPKLFHSNAAVSVERLTFWGWTIFTSEGLWKLSSFRCQVFNFFDSTCSIWSQFV